jgi:hypothetical protein
MINSSKEIIRLEKLVDSWRKQYYDLVEKVNLGKPLLTFVVSLENGRTQEVKAHYENCGRFYKYTVDGDKKVAIFREGSITSVIIKE